MPRRLASKPVVATPLGRALMLALSLFVSLEVSSCGPVVFEHGIATPADTVWRGVWQGVWVATMDEEMIRVDFDSPPVARFFFEESGTVFGYRLRPVRIGRRWFADLYPMSLTRTKKPFTALELSRDSLGFDVSADNLQMKVSADSLRVEFGSQMGWKYIILRLEIDGKGLILSYLSDSDIEELRSAHPEALPSEPDTTSNGDYNLTSSTAEIRRFLEIYGEVDSLFDPLEPMKRQR